MIAGAHTHPSGPSQRIIGSLHPTLLAILSQLHGVQISKGVCKGKSSWSFSRHSLLHHLAKHTTWHNANSSTDPMSFPQNAKRRKTLKEKTYRQTLVHAKARRCALRRVPWPSIPPMKGSITLHCQCYSIHATRFPTHCKQETRQKNACTPLPRQGNAPFGTSSGPTSGNSFGAAHCRPQCIENRAI